MNRGFADLSGFRGSFSSISLLDIDYFFSESRLKSSINFRSAKSAQIRESAIASRFLKLQHKIRSKIIVRLYVDASFVVLNDIERCGEAKAQAVSFESKIWFE